MNGEPAKTLSDPSRSCHDRLELIAELMQQNLTMTEIGRRTGLSEWQVRRTAYDHGLTRPADAGNTRLSQRQGRILAFIQDYTARHVYPPALREIVEGCDLSSTSVALYNLVALGQRGYLTRTRDVARSIVLTERGRSWSPVPPDDTPAKEAP